MVDNDKINSVDTIDGKPYFYIDSSIIIIMQRLDEFFEQEKPLPEIIAFLTKNRRMTEEAAKNFLEKYELNKKR